MFPVSHSRRARKNPKCRFGRGLLSWRPWHGGLRVEIFHSLVLAGLSQELPSQGVTVSALCPGYTKTDFQARAGFGPNMDLARLPASTAMEVAEAGYAGLIAGRREIVPGFLNKLSISLLPFLPKTRILAVISRLQQNRAPLP